MGAGSWGTVLRPTIKRPLGVPPKDPRAAPSAEDGGGPRATGLWLGEECLSPGSTPPFPAILAQNM